VALSRTILRVALWALALALTLLLVPTSSRAEPPPGSAGWLYDSTTVADVDLGLGPTSLAALAEEPREYQPGNIVLRAAGRTYGPLQVGIKLKGETSFREIGEKAAFKVKVDEYVDGQTIDGLEKLTLNNMVQDATEVHEALAYESFRKVGIPAPRTGYAQVSLNGDDYGLYLNLETLDSVSLPRWLATTRHLYEGSSGTDLKPEDLSEFEVDEGKSKQREDLQALIEAVNSDEGDWSDGLAGLADLDEMTRMWAVERYIGHWDGYAGDRDGDPSNYYLHSEASGLFRMLPWGTDQTWHRRVTFDAWGALMFDSCLRDPSCEALYRNALRQVRDQLGSTWLTARTNELAALVGPMQADEPLGEHTTREFDEGIEEMLDFIEDRPAELTDWLGDRAGGGDDADEGTPRHARLLRMRARRTTLRTRVTAPADGYLEQRGTARIGGRRLTVCFTRGRVAAGETVTIVCRLTHFAQLRLLRAGLGVRLHTCFLPVRGAGVCEPDRRLRLPRLRPHRP
jgi:hypothetical protein